MAISTGNSWKLKFGSAGAAASALTEAENVRRVEVSMRAETADASVRGDTVRKYLAGLKELSITVEILHDPQDAFYLASETAYHSGTALRLDAETLSGDFRVSEISNPQPLEDVVTDSITFVPSAGGTITLL